MTMSTLTVAAGKAFIFSLILTPIIRDIFRAYNVVDRPGRRKVHAYPIPRVGGIPIMIGYAVALFQLSAQALPYSPGWVWALVPGMAAIFCTGLIDDFFNLKPIVKLAGQVMAALLAYGNDIRIVRLGDYGLPDWASLPVTVFWLLLATNALNLIDGLDGLCAGMGFFAALTIGVAALMQQNQALAQVTFPLAAALLGFLVYNFNPATVFLGDSGALCIGFLLGCFGLIWTQDSTTLASSVMPLLAMAIPLLDVLISVVRRYLKNYPLFGADRGHTHHRLLDRGLSVRQSAGVLYLVAITGGLFALLLTWKPGWGGYRGGVLAGFLTACGVGIHELRYPEFEATRTLLLGEFRKAVATNARLGQLRETLLRAGSPADWWNSLARFSREEGLAKIAWTGGVSGNDRPEGGPGEVPSGDAAWAFGVRLEDGSVVEMAGMNTATTTRGTAPLDLIQFSAVLRETFTVVLSRSGQTILR